MTAALIFVAVLLVLGVLCRVRIALFRWLYVPASVIAGLLGLAFIQGARWAERITASEPTGSLGPAGPLAVAVRWFDPQGLAGELAQWPGWLIAVVFAALLLERQSGQWQHSVGRVSREVVMVWIIVLGQAALGLLVTWILVQPFYDVPNSFGMLIETGFAGGHGTAAAMGVVFRHPSIQLDGGLALGTLMATAGLVYGVVSGIVWINIGVRCGWIAKATPIPEPNASSAEERRRQREPIGYEVLDRDLVDSLLLQMVWIALAFSIGLLILTAVESISYWVDEWVGVPVAGSAAAVPAGAAIPMEAEAELGKRLRASSVLGSFPLFIYTLFGGWIVRTLLRLGGVGHWIDRATVQRLSAVAMDILVVAAIASLNLHAVIELIVPFSLLLVAGCVWTGVCLLWISRRVLPREHWFQLGLINYGMSTGTTATGFVLLRIVDPELRTGAAADYALAAPFSAPFIGGGMLTIALPLLVLERVPIGLSALALLACVAALVLVGFRMGRAAQR